MFGLLLVDTGNNEALFFPKLKSKELDNTCAIAFGTARSAIALYYRLIVRQFCYLTSIR